MSKTAKRWLVIATALVILGIVIFVGAMAANHWELTRLSTLQYKTRTYEIGEDFQDLSLDTDAADLLLAPSDDGTCRVVCHEPETGKYTAAVENGTLTICATDMGKWYEHLGITFEMPKITVYLPGEAYGALSIRGSTGSIEVPEAFRFTRVEISNDTGDVEWYASAAEQIKIEVSTGDIHAENISAGVLTLLNETGEVTASAVTCTGEVQVGVDVGSVRLANVACGSLSAVGDTGDIVLEQVMVSGDMTIENDIGDVTLDGCDAGEITIQTDTGDVTGTLLSEKVFLIESDTGDIDVPKTVTGGRCEIRTDIGDIKIELA